MRVKGRKQKEFFLRGDDEEKGTRHIKGFLFLHFWYAPHHSHVHFSIYEFNIPWRMRNLQGMKIILFPSPTLEINENNAR